MARMTLEQLRHSREYLALTEKQQKFVDAYLTNGCDPTAAVLAAYNPKDANTAKVMSHQLMAHPSLLYLFNLYFDNEPENAFLQHLWRLIVSRRIDEAHLRAMQLYADVQGWRKGKMAQALKEAKEMGSSAWVGGPLLARERELERMKALAFDKEQAEKKKAAKEAEKATKADQRPKAVEPDTPLPNLLSSFSDPVTSNR